MDKVYKAPNKGEVVFEDKEPNSTNQKSNQENIQDIDQEQNVNANPFQFNSQNVRIIFDNKNNCSGKITGTTYIAEYNKIVEEVVILLYFGNDTELPVCKTHSDKNGNFVIDNIPSGYYRIKAYIGDKYEYLSHYIKVFPSDNVEHSIFLKQNKEKYKCN